MLGVQQDLCHDGFGSPPLSHDARETEGLGEPTVHAVRQNVQAPFNVEGPLAQGALHLSVAVHGDVPQDVTVLLKKALSINCRFECS